MCTRITRVPHLVGLLVVLLVGLAAAGCCTVKPSATPVLPTPTAGLLPPTLAATPLPPTLTATLVPPTTAATPVPLRPAAVTAPLAYTWRNVEIVGGGFVPGIVFNTGEEGLVYARTDIGGAYRLDEETSRWIPLLDWVGWDDWNLTGVDSLATDPVEPNRLYLAAGTYTNEWTDANGAILRSTDYGATFERTDLPFKVGGNMPGRSMGERLAIDPNKNSVLYFGTRSGNGLWRSADYGVTWAKVESFPSVGTYVPNPTSDYSYERDLVGVVWVTFDPRSSFAGQATRTIYVGVADKDASIYRSLDAGETWEAVPDQPTGFLPHHGVLSANGMLYVTYGKDCGPYQSDKGDVWKYDTASGEWILISPIRSSSEDNYFGYGGLAVDAQHPDTIVVSSLESWWPDDHIFRSTDGGATWKPIWEWGSYPERVFHYTQDISGAPWLDWGARDTKPLPEVAPKLGWMIGDLEIDPFNSDRMLYGTGATIYGSDNLTAWDTGGSVDITVKAQGLEETSVQDLISPPTGDAHLISALGDLGGFRHTDLNVVPPSMIIKPPLTTGTSLDYAELEPGYVVRVGNCCDSGSPQVVNLGYSTDGGVTWQVAKSEPADVRQGGVVAVAADGSAVVWSPSGPEATVAYSTDNGATWTVSTGIPGGAQVRSDRVNPLKFYGFSGGTFYVSVDGGATFAVTVSAGLPATSLVKFKALPGAEGEIWLAGGSEEEGMYGLWHSIDSGATFEKLANVEEADVVGFGAPAPDATYPAIYISAKIEGARGLYRSDDAGASWVRINDDQHQYAYTGAAITGDPRVYGRVYVGTNGRGIIYGDGATP
jgi:hypothetical protein